MRVTVCELPHEPNALATAWAQLCEQSWRDESELVLLPELAMVEPVWDAPAFDAARWARAEAASDRWLALLRELHANQVIGTRPFTVAGKRYNQGFSWSAADGLQPLRRKYHLPDRPGEWESRWFDRGDAGFPAFRTGELVFGLNICSELWALESYAGYAAGDVQVIFAPRATAAASAAKWLSVGVVAAVRSGAFCVSSNRVDTAGNCGGIGWIISPDGTILATTSAATPCATVDIDLDAPEAARRSYPRDLFRESAAPASHAWDFVDHRRIA